MATRPNFQYGRFIIPPFCMLRQHIRLVWPRSPRVFWRHFETWVDETRLICMPPKRKNGDQNWLTDGGLRQLRRNLIINHFTTQHTGTCQQLLLIQPPFAFSERLLENSFDSNRIQYIYFLFMTNNLDVSS